MTGSDSADDLKLVLKLVPEEVGHGHVTYVRKRIHAVSLFQLWRFLVLKK